MAMAKKLPHAAAVCAWDGALTYHELDTLSTQLAHCLMDLGVGLGSMVTLCIEKSMWMPVAMLSVMKAGGVCVTVDTTQPEGRLRSIMQQVKPALVLSSATNPFAAVWVESTQNGQIGVCYTHTLHI